MEISSFWKEGLSIAKDATFKAASDPYVTGGMATLVALRALGYLSQTESVFCGMGLIMSKICQVALQEIVDLLAANPNLLASFEEL